MWKYDDKNYDNHYHKVSPKEHGSNNHRKVKKSYHSAYNFYCNKCVNELNRKGNHDDDDEDDGDDNYCLKTKHYDSECNLGNIQSHAYCTNWRCDKYYRNDENDVRNPKYKEKSTEPERNFMKKSSIKQSPKIEATPSKYPSSKQATFKNVENLQKENFLPFPKNTNDCYCSSPSNCSQKKYSKCCHTSQPNYQNSNTKSSSFQCYYNKSTSTNNEKLNSKMDENTQRNIITNSEKKSYQNEKIELLPEERKIEKDQMDQRKSKLSPIQSSNEQLSYMALINKNINATFSNLLSFATIGSKKQSSPAINIRVVSKKDIASGSNDTMNKFLNTNFSSSMSNSYGSHDPSNINCYNVKAAKQNIFENDSIISQSFTQGIPLGNKNESISEKELKVEKLNSSSSKIKVQNENCTCCHFCRNLEEKEYQMGQQKKGAKLSQMKEEHFKKKSSETVTVIQPTKMEEKSINIFVINPGSYSVPPNYHTKSSTKVFNNSHKTLNLPGFQPFQGFSCDSKYSNSTKACPPPSIVQEITKIFKSKLLGKQTDYNPVRGSCAYCREKPQTENFNKQFNMPFRSSANCGLDPTQKQVKEKIPMQSPFYLNDDNSYREQELAYGQYENAKYLFDMHNIRNCNYCSDHSWKNDRCGC